MGVGRGRSLEPARDGGRSPGRDALPGCSLPHALARPRGARTRLVLILSHLTTIRVRLTISWIECSFNRSSAGITSRRSCYWFSAFWLQAWSSTTCASACLQLSFGGWQRSGSRAKTAHVYCPLGGRSYRPVRPHADRVSRLRVERESCMRLGKADNNSRGFIGLRASQTGTSVMHGNFALLMSPVRMMTGGE